MFSTLRLFERHLSQIALQSSSANWRVGIVLGNPEEVAQFFSKSRGCVARYLNLSRYQIKNLVGQI
jgi:hypothetical protein